MHIVLGLYNRWHRNAVGFHSSRNCSEIKDGQRSNSSPLVVKLGVGGGRDGRAWKADPWSKALWTWHAFSVLLWTDETCRTQTQRTAFCVSHLATECKIESSVRVAEINC